MAEVDKHGAELVDPTPVELPLTWKKPVSLAERVRLAAREEISRIAEDRGFESFEEADDFDVGDDYDPRSPWEMEFDQEVAKVPDEKRGMTEEVPAAEKKENIVEAKVDGNGKSDSSAS